MKAIFLDRDGVIIEKAPEGEYISDCSEVNFLPGALQAISDFCHKGYKVIVVTNQRGVATGKIQPFKLEEIHTMVTQAVTRYGGEFAGIYCCPHDISERCSCRKPEPGMLLQAATKHGLDLEQCWIIGDSYTDIGAGKSAHCKTVLITGSEPRSHCAEAPDIVVTSLAEAAKLILSPRSGQASAMQHR